MNSIILFFDREYKTLEDKLELRQLKEEPFTKIEQLIEKIKPKTREEEFQKYLEEETERIMTRNSPHLLSFENYKDSSFILAKAYQKIIDAIITNNLGEMVKKKGERKTTSLTNEIIEEIKLIDLESLIISSKELIKNYFFTAMELTNKKIVFERNYLLSLIPSMDTPYLKENIESFYADYQIGLTQGKNTEQKEKQEKNLKKIVENKSINRIISFYDKLSDFTKTIHLKSAIFDKVEKIIIKNFSQQENYKKQKKELEEFITENNEKTIRTINNFNEMKELISYISTDRIAKEFYRQLLRKIYY